MPEATNTPGEPEMLDLDITTILSHRTKQGLVQLRIGDKGGTQMSPEKARQVAGMLYEAAEAAESDGLFWSFFGSIDMGETETLAALRQFRTLRAKRAEIAAK